MKGRVGTLGKGSLKKVLTFCSHGWGGSRLVFVTLFKNMVQMYPKNGLVLKKKLKIGEVRSNVKILHFLMNGLFVIVTLNLLLICDIFRLSI